MNPRKDNGSNPDLIIIGAGPVGLYTAIQLAEEKHKISILMIEKHEIYQRTQRLKLNLSLIINTQLQNALLQKGHRLDNQHIDIPIQEMEDCLLAHAKKRGIEIAYKQFLTEEQYAHQLQEHKVNNKMELEKILEQEIIVGTNGIKQDYPSCKIVIGADGSRSSVRDAIMDKKSAPAAISKKDLRNMIELKYQVHGKVHKMATMTYYLTQSLLGGFLCTENITNDEARNRSEVTVRFIVDDKTYNDPSLRGINARNLMALNRYIPTGLYNAINIWLNTRADKDIIIQSPTLNKTTLSIYTSKKYVSEMGELLVFLVGDASCGFPFMNGLNLGIKNSRKLVDLISAAWETIAKLDGKKHQHAVIEQLIKSYTQQTAATFKEGDGIVEKANSKMEVQQTSVRALYLFSFPIKGAQKYRRSFEHEIFSANEIFDLRALDLYNKNLGRGTLKSQLCLSLLALLQPVLDKPINEVDLDKLKIILYHAYKKNQTLEEFWDKSFINYYFGDYVIYSPSPRIQAATMAKYSGNTEIPEVLNSHQGRRFSQDLHKIIYQLYQHVIKFETHLRSVAVREDKDTNGALRRIA